MTLFFAYQFVTCDGFTDSGVFFDRETRDLKFDDNALDHALRYGLRDPQRWVKGTVLASTVEEAWNAVREGAWLSIAARSEWEAVAA